MSDKKTQIDWTNLKFSNDRFKFRKEIIEIFLKENPGTGKGDATSRYVYLVKILKDGRKIYLNRPAIFNKGLDFTLNVSNTNFSTGLLTKKGNPKRASTRPTHNNILVDLENKKVENLDLYKLFVKQVDLIYGCQNPTNIVFDFKTGHSTELILECIKWLFAEQDLTYWNYSGRAMLYKSIKEI